MEGLFKREMLQFFYGSYADSVDKILKYLKISEKLTPDHIGCQLHEDEYDKVESVLNEFSTKLKEIVLHERRVGLFTLHDPLSGIWNVSKVEIFEPKKNVDLHKLRYGIEHIAFTVGNINEFISKYKNIIPIAKIATINNAKFLKTEVINSVEIEFRNDPL